MAWSTLATPTFHTRKRKTKINLRQFGASFSGGVDSVNQLHQLYKGRQDRIERYRVYDNMHQDSDVARALDIVAEHCTNTDNDTSFPFKFNYVTETPTREESMLLEENMKHWLKMNEFNKRLFRNIRSVLKYGDWFYYRNPHTFELYNLHPKLVLAAIVEKEKMKVLGWVVRDFKFNVEDMEISQTNHALHDHLRTMTQGSGFQNAKIIPAEHILHLSLNEGRFSGSEADDDPTDTYSSRWPFGESYLEQIYKIYKQRELLEDACLIHRVQRAPTRRVWYIDTGKMRADHAQWTVQQFKQELNQKRLPQTIGMEGRTVDTVYNPLSQLEDYYIPVSMDARGSKIENLEGIPWNDLPDLKYFTMKMLRALRVPYSFLVGPEEGGALFQDGKVGTAYMQEIEFSKFCRRIQLDVEHVYDFEFKVYLKVRGIDLINSGDFELKMIPPTDWEADQQRSRNTANLQVMSTAAAIPWMSQRFAAKTFGGLTDHQLTKNEQMKLEEMQKGGMAAVDPMGGGMGGMDMMPGGPMGGVPGGFNELGNPEEGMGGQETGMGSQQAGGAIGAAGGGADGLGGAGAGGAGGGFGESAMSDRPILLEDELTLGDLEPADPKIKDVGIYKQRTPKDELFGNHDPIKNTKDMVSLAQLRKLRIYQMNKRIETEKRMKIIATIYAPPAEGGMGGLGGPPGGGAPLF